MKHIIRVDTKNKVAYTEYNGIELHKGWTEDTLQEYAIESCKWGIVYKIAPELFTNSEYENVRKSRNIYSQQEFDIVLV